jgi:hypothetical protein
MPNLFDLIKNVSYIKDIDSLDVEYETYSQFILNRYLAAEADCLFAVSMMNERKHIPTNIQNLFLFYAIPKRNRFFKYEKKEKLENLFDIMKHYKCSYNTAKEYSKILTEEQVKEIIKRMDVGGN